MLLYIYILLSFYASVPTIFLQPPHGTLSFILFFISDLPQAGLLLQIRGNWILVFKLTKAGNMYEWLYMSWTGTMWVVLHANNLWWSNWQVYAWETGSLMDFCICLNDSDLQFSVIEIHTEFSSECRLQKKWVWCFFCKYSHSKTNTVYNFFRSDIVLVYIHRKLFA